jgi:hypothetical protein
VFGNTNQPADIRFTRQKTYETGFGFEPTGFSILGFAPWPTYNVGQERAEQSGDLGADQAGHFGSGDVFDVRGKILLEPYYAFVDLA